MASVHMKYGGSAIERTMLCPGSVKAIAELPVRPTSPHAERGTRIHTWYERYLKGDLSVKAETDQDKKEAFIAAKAGEKTKEILASFGMDVSEFLQEKLMVFHPNYPNAGGSPDLFGFQVFRDLVVVDLKAGFNQVEAINNHQGGIYCCTVANNIDPMARWSLVNCHFIIIQPNEDGSEVAARIWSFPMADLDALQAMYMAGIDRAEANPDERIPGDHCQGKYCDARTTCPQHLAWKAASSNDEATKTFLLNAAQAPDPASRLKALLDGAKGIEDLIKQAKQDAKDMLAIHPTAISGWYLKTDVQGDREWADAKKAEKALKDLGFKVDEVAPRKLVSVAQAEKLLKAKNIEADKMPAVVRPDGNPQLKAGENPNVIASFAPPAEAAPPNAFAATAAV